MTRLPELWEPFRWTARLSRLMDELFEEVGRGFSRTGRALGAAFVGLGRTDVYEQDGKLVFETELPGVRKEDLDLRVEDGRLVLSGEVKRTATVDEEDYYYMGRAYGRFQRVLPLPEEAEVADPKAIRAKFANGVLRVEVPLKQPLKRGKALEIEVE